MQCKGSFVALITPFTHLNKVDYLCLENLLRWHLVQNTHGIVILGTTGEGPTISDLERKEIIRLTCEIVQKKVPVIVGTGTNNTQKSIEYTLEAKELGADGCLVVAPYYNRPTQEGCLAHFEEIAKANLPLIIYHHPKRTGLYLTLDTLQRLQECPNIIGIKDASADIEWIRKLIQCTSLKVLSGDDDRTFDALRLGAAGSISVIANLIPQSWASMHELALQKQFNAAKEIIDSYLPLLNALNLETNPQCVKYALSYLGKCNPYLRLPMILPRKENQKIVKEVLDQISTLGISV